MKTIPELLAQKPVMLDRWVHPNDALFDFFGLYINNHDYIATSAPYPNVASWLEKKAAADNVLAENAGVNILFGYYSCLDYSGSAFVLFEQDGKLYEVNGSHCSCNGLEGQWEPEETDLKVLEKRLNDGKLGRGYTGYGGGYENEFANELREFLGIDAPQ